MGAWDAGLGLTRDVITRATILVRLLYASLTWCGLMSTGDVDRVEGLLKGVQNGDFLPAEAPTATHNIMADVAYAPSLLPLSGIGMMSFLNY